MSDNAYIVEGPPKPSVGSQIGSYLGCLVMVLLLAAAPFVVRELTRKFSDAELAQLESELLKPYETGRQVKLSQKTIKGRHGKLVLIVPSIWSASGKAELDETHEYLPEDVRADSFDKVGTVVFVHRGNRTQSEDYRMEDTKKVKTFQVETTATTVFVFARKTKEYLGRSSSAGAPKDRIMVKQDQNRVDAGGGSAAHNMVKFLPDLDRAY